MNQSKQRSWIRLHRVLDLLGLLALALAVWSLDLLSIPWQSACAVSFSPDGKMLAAGLYEGKALNEDFHNYQGEIGRAVKVFDAQSGGSFCLLECKRLDGNPLVPPYGQFLSYSPEGETLAVGNWDGTVGLWNGRTGQLKQILASQMNRVTRVTFSNDGRWLAASHWWTTLLSTAHLAEPRLLEQQGRVGSIAFSADSKLFAEGLLLGEGVQIWNLENYERKEIIPIPEFNPLHQQDISELAFSPDGNLLAIAATDWAWVWNIRARKKQLAVDGRALCVAFSPDGATLAIGGENGLKFWNVESGEEISFLPNSTRVRSLAYSPDGSLLATGDDSGEVIVREPIGGVKRWSARLHGPPRPLVLPIIGFLAGVVLLTAAWLVHRRSNGTTARSIQSPRP